MGRVSQQCFAKPAIWVVAKRIKERQLGFRAVQVLAFIKTRLEAGLPPPSYSMICDELGIDGRGNVSRIVRHLERRGELEIDDARIQRRTPTIIGVPKPRASAS